MVAHFFFLMCIAWRVGRGRVLGGGTAREGFLGRTGTEASRAAGGSGSWAVEWALAQTSVCLLLLELLAGWLCVCGCVCVRMHVKQGTELQHLATTSDIIPRTNNDESKFHILKHVFSYKMMRCTAITGTHTCRIRL